MTELTPEQIEQFQKTNTESEAVVEQLSRLGEEFPAKVFALAIVKYFVIHAKACGVPLEVCLSTINELWRDIHVERVERPHSVTIVPRPAEATP